MNLPAANNKARATVARGLKIGLSVVVTLFMLAASEVGLRLAEKPHSNIVLHDLEESIKNTSTNVFLNVIVDDPELFWRLAPNKSLPDDLKHIRGLISNGSGLREDHEIPLEKPHGQIRILFVGDSTTFGFESLHRDSFVEQVELLLKERFPSAQVECINAGVPGYTLEQGWRQLVSTGLGYHPDLIVTAFGWNDSKRWEQLSDLQLFELSLKATPPGILARSEVVRRIWQLSTRLRGPRKSSKKVPRVAPAEYEELLHRVRALARSNNAEFLPMVWPIKANFEHGGIETLTEYQKIVYRLGRDEFTFGPQNGPGFIDPIPHVAQALKQHKISELFVDGVHTRPLANRIVAEAIAEKIQGWYAHAVQR